MASFFAKAHYRPHPSPTFRNFLVGCQWQHVPLRVALNDLRSANNGAYRTAQQTDDKCLAADRDLVVRMRVLVPAPIFPACGDAPTYCYAEQ